MNDTVVLTGMVLTWMPIGDYDKRITILTTTCGKITAFARGARRPTSQLSAATGLFAFGEFELSEGKSAYTLHKATIRNYFRELTMDPDAAYLGMYFLEFCEFFCQENNDEKEMLKLLYQSLRALQSTAFSRRLVRSVFELKAMTLNGEGPEVFSCLHCRKREDLRLFSVRRGGVFCPACVGKIPAFPISASLLYTMQFIISSPVEKLYTFRLKEETEEELAALLRHYMEHYIHHSFKSLEILEQSSSLLDSIQSDPKQ